MVDADELELLRSTVRGALGAGATLADLGGLGLLGLLVPEERGGAGWRPVEAAAVAVEVGRRAGATGAPGPGQPPTGAPWLEASLAAMVLADGPDELRDDLLPGALDGSSPVVVARAAGDLAGGRFSGIVQGVVGGPAAVVVEVGPTPVLLRRAGGGVEVGPDPTSIDHTVPVEAWAVHEVPAVVLAGADGDLLGDTHRVLAAASLLGLLSAAVERLIPYLTDRVAFGAPIASFQAVQHRVVDLTLLEVRGRVAVDAAARALAERGPAVPRLAGAAHGHLAAAVPAALDECIQLTGGIGFTWEYPLHQELRRAVALAAAGGGPPASRRRFLAAGAAR